MDIERFDEESIKIEKFETIAWCITRLEGIPVQPEYREEIRDIVKEMWGIIPQPYMEGIRRLVRMLESNQVERVKGKFKRIPSFKRKLYRLNVPGRDGILIHSGNCPNAKTRPRPAKRRPVRKGEL